MSRSHEQSIADSFNGFIRKRADRLGIAFHAFALDGQDRGAGADYLLTGSQRFALVEFKYSEGNLKSENKKSHMFNFCVAVEGQCDMQELHDRGHFIAWGSDGSVATNVYRAEICNQEIFVGETGLPCLGPIVASRCSATQFADDFFSDSGDRYLVLEEFETYLEWLLSATGSEQSMLELVAFDPDASDLIILEFATIRKVQEWFMRQERGNQYDWEPPTPF